MPAATTFPGKWARKCATNFHTALSSIVFLFLDFLETLLCVIFRYLDEFFEGNPPHCYCDQKKSREQKLGEEEKNELSETLYGRKNVFRKMGFLGFARKYEECKKTSGGQLKNMNRWSDCVCESCVSWTMNDDNKLHVVVKEPSQASVKDSTGNPIENVIFLHGFISSSSLWTETVFQNLSEPLKGNYRLISVDLLGFGKSPKPRDGLYTLREHLDMIEKSVICPFDLKSFHVVAHSMGCTIALAVAAKYSKSVKSVTLVAPLYLPSSKDEASFTVLNRLAERRLWPPLLFASSFMSWYEHLGRCVCFVICRNHRIWESTFKLLTRRREVPFMIMDLTKHTHHSAWHSMHNVVCGGAKYVDDYLNTLIEQRIKMCVIQGDQDAVIPLECSINIKKKVPDAEVFIISNADHRTVILGREKEFTRSLERIWSSSSADTNTMEE
ncbi:hypothetical protein LWI29_003733 [Acer saccharum]|uniref:AB hydrolase-1 domain-containing protein n=1 Tax=Acer saccharum TaxID=4024 RepID=A0AA39T277_ACESA|nr:hypothetical protein LWI29_003733 [Acer saccharum]